MEQNLSDFRGQALKRYEDTLDAVFCAYLAWYCWRWGEERNQQFGKLADGYIVVPKAPVE
jgi:predicted RNase H-like nuclease